MRRSTQRHACRSSSAVVPLSDTGATTGTATDETPALPGDAVRERIVQQLRDALGDALVDSLGQAGRRHVGPRAHRRVAAAGLALRDVRRLRLLLLPVGHRLDAQPVRPRRGRPDAAAARARHRDPSRATPAATPACRCSPGSPAPRATSASRSRPTCPTTIAGRRQLDPGLRRRQLARARGARDVRHRLRRPPRPAQHVPADRLRGPPAAQGLPAARAHGEAVAGHRRRRAAAGRRRGRGRGADAAEGDAAAATGDADGASA